MEFIPLTLGTPRPRAAPQGPNDEPGGRTAEPRDHDAWREAREGLAEAVDPIPAEQVLARLRQAAAAPPGDQGRPWVVLGEPGAGKTRLLAHWHDTWLRALCRTPLRLGLPVPALVRFRDLASDAFRGGRDAVADRLWAAAADERAATLRDAGHLVGAEALAELPGRLFLPVWLLDGLDEFAAPAGDAALWAALAALPGIVVVSCRRAVFDATRPEAQRRVGAEYRIGGLKPGAEQEAFLAAALRAFAGLGEEVSQARARELVGAMNASPALRPLASSPQLLVLVAEASDALVLPRSRAEFYEAAVEALWARKLDGRPDLLALAGERDAALAALAFSLGPSRAEARAAELREAGVAGALAEALERSGLLRVHRARGSAEFRHLTFQEHYLARALSGGRRLSEGELRAVLDARWAEVEWEETLALLLAAQRPASIEAVLTEFARDWQEAHWRDPHHLWALRRSPARFALRVLGRSGVAVCNPLLGIGLRSGLVCVALASFRGAPPEALAALARDGDVYVRECAAANPATPPEALAALARDGYVAERQRVEKFPAPPVLQLRAPYGPWLHDPFVDFRRSVAENPATPLAVLDTLANDLDASVRRGVAANPATPPAVLAELARDGNAEVRRQAARNGETVIEDLTQDPARA